jgi:hypothetical protein
MVEKNDVEARIVTREHHSDELIELPVARVQGTNPGPQQTVMSGRQTGEPARPEQETLRGRRSQFNAEMSGVWHPAVNEGDIVERCQHLGRLTDYFGNTLREYHSPARSLVLYYWSNPAINAELQPHGYDWHSGLVSALEFED